MSDRDYNYDYFGIKTLERAYLLKINGAIAECPQHMLMRVSIGKKIILFVFQNVRNMCICHILWGLF